MFNLSPDELLTSTRAVRRRLDFTKPVPREVIEECVSIAQQAPNAGNSQDWHFVIVKDPQLRIKLGELYRKGRDRNFPKALSNPSAPPSPDKVRMKEDATYLADHMQDAPVLVIPCIAGRTDGFPTSKQAVKWASIIPAVWSFMLAARARGLGTTITTNHLAYEEETAELLRIPFREVMQTMLVPVAYTKGESYKRGLRKNPSSMIHWDRW